MYHMEFLSLLRVDGSVEDGVGGKGSVPVIGSSKFEVCVETGFLFQPRVEVSGPSPGIECYPGF